MGQIQTVSVRPILKPIALLVYKSETDLMRLLRFTSLSFLNFFFIELGPILIYMK